MILVSFLTVTSIIYTSSNEYNSSLVPLIIPQYDVDKVDKNIMSVPRLENPPTPKKLMLNNNPLIALHTEINEFLAQQKIPIAIKQQDNTTYTEGAFINVFESLVAAAKQGDAQAAFELARGLHKCHTSDAPKTAEEFDEFLYELDTSKSYRGQYIGEKSHMIDFIKQDNRFEFDFCQGLTDNHLRSGTAYLEQAVNSKNIEALLSVLPIYVNFHQGDFPLSADQRIVIQNKIFISLELAAQAGSADAYYKLLQMHKQAGSVHFDPVKAYSTGYAYLVALSQRYKAGPNSTLRFRLKTHQLMM